MDQRKERIEKYREMPEEFKTLVDCWPWTHCCFTDMQEFSGNAMSPGRLRNLSNQGEGPPAFYIGKRKAADKIDLAYWLFQHTNKVNAKDC